MTDFPADRPISSPAPAPAHGISFGAAVRVWLRIALLSFGGPAGQIAVMHRILVDEKNWISESRFLHALNYCMLLPGPEAQQLATYIGWLLHRTVGGIVAGGLFILPGVVSPDLPAGFASFAAYGDFATGVLAMLALLTVRIRPLFWTFVVAFNVVGTVDLIVDYYHAIQADLPAHAGLFGATYAIPVIYVPLLMITHVAAFYLLVRPQQGAVRAVADGATA